MQAFLRTPDRHEPTASRSLTLKPSNRTCLQVAGLQELAKAPGIHGVHRFRGITYYRAYTFVLSSVFDIVYGNIMLKAPALIKQL